MGGRGSGRWRDQAARPLADASHPLHVGDIRHVLRGLWRASGRVHHEGVIVAGDALSLPFKAGFSANDLIVTLYPPQRLPERLPATFLVPAVGGQRWLWRCHCGRRAAILYAPAGYSWHCRACHEITYGSSNHRDAQIEALSRRCERLSPA